MPRVRSSPLRLLAAVLGALLLTACTSPPARRPAAPGPTSTGTGASGGAASGTAPADQASALQALRARLTPPALPSFTLPTDLLTSDQDRRVAKDLDLEPGLYEGIAVLDARCDASGHAAAADAGTPASSAAGHFDDGTHDITVAGDGTGVYDAPGQHIAVLADGSGVYDDGTTRLQVQPGGAGTYTGAGTRLAVRADGSGSYDDGVVRLWVGSDGAGGYDDAGTHVTVSADGQVRTRGDAVISRAAVELIAERLPRFAAVPRIVRVVPVGASCGTVVRLDADLLFDTGRDTVRPAAQETLRRVATLLAALAHPRTQVVGHTDAQGSAAYNQDLSVRRAAAVQAALVGAGVPRGTLQVVGRGETEPLRPEVRADGSVDPAAQAQDRRVELVLLQQ